MDHTRLTLSTQLAAAAASVYANPAGKKTHVRGFLLHNTNNISENLSLYWVPDASGAVGVATLAMRLYRIALAADETLQIEIPYGLVMTGTNESIQGFSSNASKVNCVVLGDTE